MLPCLIAKNHTNKQISYSTICEPPPPRLTDLITPRLLMLLINFLCYGLPEGFIENTAMLLTWQYIIRFYAPRGKGTSATFILMNFKQKPELQLVQLHNWARQICP